jgi:hypothetical protein
MAEVIHALVDLVCPWARQAAASEDVQGQHRADNDALLLKRCVGAAQAVKAAIDRMDHFDPAFGVAMQRLNAAFSSVHALRDLPPFARKGGCVELMDQMLLDLRWRILTHSRQVWAANTGNVDRVEALLLHSEPAPDQEYLLHDPRLRHGWRTCNTKLLHYVMDSIDYALHVGAIERARINLIKLCNILAIPHWPVDIQAPWLSLTNEFLPAGASVAARAPLERIQATLQIARDRYRACIVNGLDMNHKALAWCWLVEPLEKAQDLLTRLHAQARAERLMLLAGQPYFGPNHHFTLHSLDSDLLERIARHCIS